MSLSITEQLQQQPKKPARGSGLREVLAVRGEITQAIDDGHSLLSIWELLSGTGTVTIGYPQFCRHVANHIRKDAPPQKAVSKVIASGTPTDKSSPIAKSNKKRAPSVFIGIEKDSELKELLSKKPDVNNLLKGIE